MRIYVHREDLDILLKYLESRRAKTVELHTTLEEFHVVNWVASATPSRLGDMPVFVVVTDGPNVKYVRHSRKGHWSTLLQSISPYNLRRLRDLWISETLKEQLGVN